MLTAALLTAAAAPGGGNDLLGVGRTSVIVTTLSVALGIVILIVALRLTIDKKSTGDFRHHGSSIGTVVLDVILFALGAAVIAGGIAWGSTIVNSVLNLA